jgi:hypothetical protein
VIISVIPFPQTQFRVARPKRASPEGSILSGCIAWYPCVKPDSRPDSPIEVFSKPKLAYTWDRYLAIRQVSEVTEEREDGKEGPPRLSCKLLSEWIGEETIVAVQWLLQQVCPIFHSVLRVGAGFVDGVATIVDFGYVDYASYCVMRSLDETSCPRRPIFTSYD